MKTVELCLSLFGLVAQSFCIGAFMYGFFRRKYGVECAAMCVLGYVGLCSVDLICGATLMSGRSPTTLVGCSVLLLLPDLFLGLAVLCAYKVFPAAIRFAEYLIARKTKKGTSC